MKKRPTSWRRVATTLIGAMSLTAIVGCGEDPPPAPPPKFDFTVEVEVTDSNENPLAKMPVTLDGRTVGYTDADGKFSGTLRENEGAQITVGVETIEGYRLLADPPSVTEMLKVTTVNNQQSGVPIFLQVQAESLKKDYLVWVKTACETGLEAEDCEGLDVMLNGEQVATTNQLGYAHFTFTDVPQNDVEIELKTPSDSKMSPQNPTYMITLDLDSHIYLVEEDFIDPDAKKKKTRRNVRRRRRPATKKKAASKPKVEKPKKDDGVIDLW